MFCAVCFLQIDYVFSASLGHLSWAFKKKAFIGNNRVRITMAFYEIFVHIYSNTTRAACISGKFFNPNAEIEAAVAFFSKATPKTYWAAQQIKLVHFCCSSSCSPSCAYFYWYKKKRYSLPNPLNKRTHVAFGSTLIKTLLEMWDIATAFDVLNSHSRAGWIQMSTFKKCLVGVGPYLSLTFCILSDYFIYKLLNEQSPLWQTGFRCYTSEQAIGNVISWKHKLRQHMDLSPHILS